MPESVRAARFFPGEGLCEYSGLTSRAPCDADLLEREPRHQKDLELVQRVLANDPRGRERAIIDAGRDAPDMLEILSLAGGASGAKGAMFALRGEAASLTAFTQHFGPQPADIAEAVRNCV